MISELTCGTGLAAFPLVVKDLPSPQLSLDIPVGSSTCAKQGGRSPRLFLPSFFSSSPLVVDFYNLVLSSSVFSLLLWYSRSLCSLSLLQLRASLAQGLVRQERRVTIAGSSFISAPHLFTNDNSAQSQS